MQKLWCLNFFRFNDLMKENNWNDNNIPDDCAFISICCTDDCKKGYLEARNPDANDEHWFNFDHDNVINLNFDDIDKEEYISKTNEGIFTYKSISDDQAKQLVLFIEKNKDKNFYIHCRAGKSRSQAVVRYILDVYKDHEWKTNPNNPNIQWNSFVHRKLIKNYNF